MSDMDNDEYRAFEEEQQQLDEIFGDIDFTVSIPLNDMDDLLTDRTWIVIKNIYTCYCYEHEPRTADYFVICGDSLTIKYVLLELKKQNLHLDCNHRFIEGFQKDSECQYSLILGS